VAPGASGAQTVLASLRNSRRTPPAPRRAVTAVESTGACGYTREVARRVARVIFYAKGVRVNALIYVVVAVHALLAIGLVVFVLLHSGKGTGLSSMFGGMSSAAGGTSIIEKNLDRITIGIASGWALTSVILMMWYRPV
jgi:preprotein translocase subunit SecG